MRQIGILAAIAALAACDQQANQPAANEADADAVASVDETVGGDAAAPGENMSAPANDISEPANDITDREMRWNFARTARGPKLTYGEPYTDNVRLTLRCRGRDSVELSFMRPGSAAANGDPMSVAAGGAERRLEATVEKTQLGPVMVRAVTPISSQPIRSFRNGSALQVRWRDETFSVPPAGEQGRRLLDACRV